jgi:hypothetical protein
MDAWKRKCGNMCNGIVFGFKKEGNSDICCNMDET